MRRLSRGQPGTQTARPRPCFCARRQADGQQRPKLAADAVVDFRQGVRLAESEADSSYETDMDE